MQFNKSCHRFLTPGFSLCLLIHSLPTASYGDWSSELLKPRSQEHRPGTSIDRIEEGSSHPLSAKDIRSHRDETQPAQPSEESSPRGQAREIIVNHLVQIYRNGDMAHETVRTSYWRGVFKEAGRSDLYFIAKDDLSTALTAGRNVSGGYGGNKSMAQVRDFASAALEALGSKGAINPGPVPTSRLSPEAKATALQFTKGEMAKFSIAAFNRDDLPEATFNLIKAAAVFKNPAFTKAVQEFAILSKSPWKNSDSLLKLGDTLNNTLHENGLHVNLSVRRPEESAPEGRLLVLTYEITDEKNIDVKGQSIPIFEIRKADGLNTDLAVHGHHEEGYSFAFTNGGSLDERAGEIGRFQMGQTNLALTMPTNSGRQPIIGIPKESSKIPAKLDGIIRADLGKIKPNELRQKLGDSTAQHEAFHVYFIKNGGEARVLKQIDPAGVGSIQEQGAYLHQLAATDPQLTKVVLADMFNKAFGGSGGSTTSGNAEALFGLQEQLPQIKFFKQTLAGNYTNVVDFSQLPKLFSLKPEQIQAAATAARDDFLKRY